MTTVIEKTSLTPAERWIILLTTSIHCCVDYCVAANSTLAQMMEVPDDVIQAVRSGQALADERHEALRKLVKYRAAIPIVAFEYCRWKLKV